MLNYVAGLILAFVAIGSLVAAVPLNITEKEYILLFSVLCFSLCVMLIVEGIVFYLHIRPIRLAFHKDLASFQELYHVYEQIHRLPSLSVKRILGPHMLGSIIPGAGLSLYLIQTGHLSVPSYYVLLASLGGLVVSSMHALVEFYLTSNCIRPLLEEINSWSSKQFGRELSLGGRVIVPILKKLRWSFFIIGVSPLLLLGLSVQFRLGLWGESAYTYWQWAGFILTVGLGFAFIGSRLLAREIMQPIQHLYQRMSLVKSGHFRVFATDLYSDEFSRLVSGFNHMLRGIQMQAARNNQLIDSYFATLAAALDARDPYTAGHSLRVANYAVKIGKLANLPEETIDELRKSALLHDIGKIGIPDAVLLKEGRLSKEEWELIKEHPALGEAILKQIEPKDAMAPFLPGVRSHHERYDGRGYPDALQGDQIPLFGRIIAVADAFDAMTSDRPYRKGLNTSQAITILENGRGTQWDPYYTELFVEEYRHEMEEAKLLKTADSDSRN